MDMSDKDMIAAKEYTEWSEKGLVKDGRRVTIISKKKNYEINELVNIQHFLEATIPGYKMYIMGPKAIFDEYINGRLQGKTLKAKNQDPFIPTSYDGRVKESPAIDGNYQITSYIFSEPGVYEICWQPGKWKSNILKIEVE